MSASEKLKALETEIQRDKDYQDESVVLDALPQIVAVVEAAEAIDMDRRKELMTSQIHEDKLADAIADLEDALR